MRPEPKGCEAQAKDREAQAKDRKAQAEGMRGPSKVTISSSSNIGPELRGCEAHKTKDCGAQAKDQKLELMGCEAQAKSLPWGPWNQGLRSP